MFCKLSSPGRSGRHVILGLAALLSFSAACGHKEPPFPPPLRHPATSTDLTVVQRGDEFVLTFGFPQTTVSGTTLEPIQLIEYWELNRSVPQWVPPVLEDEEEAEEGTELSDDAPVSDETGDEALETTIARTVFEGLAGSGDDPSLPDAAAAEAADDEATADAADDEATTDDSDTEEEPDEDLPPPPPPVEPTKEELLTIDGREFTATATLRSTLEGDAVTSATFGDQVVISLPIVPLPEGADMEQAESTLPADDSPDDTDEAIEEDVALELEHGTLFAIKTGVSPKLISSFSNVVVIARRTAPAPPEAFSLESAADRITLRWPVGDAELLGFHIYRRDAQSPVYGPPLAFVPFQDPLKTTISDADGDDDEVSELEEEGPIEREYSDRTALYGQRYIYALTAVSNRGPVVESAITLEREVDYNDRFPPSTPQSVIALAESGRVRLLWNASPQPDVAGYIVLRSERGGEFERISEDLALDLEFSDRNARSGQAYSYRVVAIDESGNESDPSLIVEVRAP